MRQAFKGSKTHKGLRGQFPIEDMHDHAFGITTFPSTEKISHHESRKHDHDTSKNDPEKKWDRHHHKFINTPEEHSGGVVHGFENKVLIFHVFLTR